MDTESKYGVDTLAPLRDQDVPPLDVSIQRAVATGRRRQRTRTVAAVSVGVLAVTGGVFALTDRSETPAPVVTEPGLRCTVAALPVPKGGTPATTTAVSPNGRFVAGAVLGSEETGVDGTALLWDNGRLRVLDVEGLSPTPLAVNSSGTVVGGVTRDHRQVAWVFRDGRIEILAGLPEHQMVAFDVNDRGDIAGGASGPADRDQAVVWEADRPGIVRAPVGPVPSTGSGISATRLMVGSGAGVPQLWDLNANESRALPGLNGQTTGTATAIAGDWVLGTSGNRQARWNLSRGTVEPIDGMEAAGITAAGDLVGTDDVSAATRPYRDALVRRTGTPVTLPPLAGPRDLEAATAVSADGRVIAGEHTHEESSTPIVWHC